MLDKLSATIDKLDVCARQIKKIIDKERDALRDAARTQLISESKDTQHG